MNRPMFLLFTLMLFTISAQAEPRFLENSSSSYGQSLEISKSLYREQSESADIAIFENPIFGRVLALDGWIRMTEKDEIIYSEMMAHVPLLAHTAPRDVLILGESDGTILREVLKHKSVEHVVFVEKDTKVIELTKKYFGDLLEGAFEDPRVSLVIQDPKEYVNTSSECFDVVICDGATVDCKEKLQTGGICVSRTEISFFQREDLLQTYRHLKGEFEHVAFYIISIPSHPWGMITISWASDERYRLSMKRLQKRMEDVEGKMQYYNPAIHKAAFRLPQYFFK